MEKYLVTIEFRYSDMPKTEHDSDYRSKKVTIGVYDSFDEACLNGNNVLENLESRFDIHTYPDGRKADKGRLSSHGGYLGGKLDLISNLAYLKTPFTFYIQITTLKYENINESIDSVLSSIKRYRIWYNNPNK